MKIRIFSDLSAFIPCVLHEFLKQKQNLGKGKEFYVELTLAEIRSMFCFSDSEYKANKDLRVYVIEPALKEIHEQTDLSITDTQF